NPEDGSVHNDKGSALESRGSLERKLGQYAAARESFTDAIAAFDRAMTCRAVFPDALNNKALALLGRGDLEADLAEYVAAHNSFRAALSAFDRALAAAP